MSLSRCRQAGTLILSRRWRGNRVFSSQRAAASCSARSKARRIKNQFGLDLIVIDYLQLMNAYGLGKNAPREQEIATISRSLKGLAKELEIPVIALSQLNRDLEKRADKHPQMSDLRESGALEQDSDIIMFIYRDVVYNPENVENEAIAEIQISKNRSGPTGKVELRYFKEFTLFENFAADDEFGDGSMRH